MINISVTLTFHKYSSACNSNVAHGLLVNFGPMALTESVGCELQGAATHLPEFPIKIGEEFLPFHPSIGSVHVGGAMEYNPAVSLLAKLVLRFFVRGDICMWLDFFAETPHNSLRVLLPRCEAQFLRDL